MSGLPLTDKYPWKSKTFRFSKYAIKQYFLTYFDNFNPRDIFRFSNPENTNKPVGTFLKSWKGT